MSRISPINLARWARFRANRRGYWSLWIFLVLFTLSLFAELLANDKPLLVRYDNRFYTPLLVNYPETTFGGQFATTTDFRDPTWRRVSRNMAGVSGRRSVIATIPLTMPLPSHSPPRLPD